MNVALVFLRTIKVVLLNEPLIRTHWLAKVYSLNMNVVQKKRTANLFSFSFKWKSVILISWKKKNQTISILDMSLYPSVLMPCQISITLIFLLFLLICIALFELLLVFCWSFRLLIFWFSPLNFFSFLTCNYMWFSWF